MHPKEEIDKLLDEHNFELQRDKNHLVYRQRGTGKTFTLAKTPSDFRAYPNALRDLKNLIGIQRPAPVVGERRERKRKPQVTSINFTQIECNIASRPTFQDQLAKVRSELTLEGVTITGRKPSQPEMQFIEPPRHVFVPATKCWTFDSAKGTFTVTQFEDGDVILTDDAGTSFTLRPEVVHGKR